MIFRSIQHVLVICSYYILMLTIPSFIGVTNTAAMGTSVPAPERPVCIYFMSNEVQSDYDNDQGGDELLGDGTVLCASPSDYCFSFWNVPITPVVNATTKNKFVEETVISANSPGFSWLARGCFKNADMCHQERCVANEKEMDDNFFCCCKGSHCNEKISLYLPLMHPKAGHSGSGLSDPSPEPLSAFSYILLICIFFVMALGSFGGGAIYIKRKRNNKPLPDSPLLELGNSSTSPCIDLKNLVFLEEIGHGRYGTVRRAMLGDEEVAVKLFLQHHKLSFTNEKYIYTLPFMEHPNLLTFLGGEEIIGPDLNPYLGLVLSYCPHGNLNLFLQQNTLDWGNFCKVIISMVKGLGHLHSVFRRGDLMKPCVVHRDFNTRNILLKNDMTCIVSDLGFAIGLYTQGPNIYMNGEEHLQIKAPLTDVGTLRYLAPEALNGVVNLRDCEESLKQVDIYSLGLVLWEVACRCHDLYQGMPTPAYALPYEAEVGLYCDYKEFHGLLDKEKVRPQFPLLWDDSNPAIRQLKETIEDCWDNDADARLSAICVEKRLQEMKNLWQ